MLGSAVCARGAMHCSCLRAGTLKCKGFGIKLVRYLLKFLELESSQNELCPTRVGIILPVVCPVREIRGLSSRLSISSWRPGLSVLLEAWAENWVGLASRIWETPC